LYEYKARVVSAYDADTIRADIDLGFNMWMLNAELRLNRINAPEMKGEQRPMGLAARNYMLTLIPVGATVFLRTQKDATEKYGRYLADIYPLGFDMYCLNDRLVFEGFAKYYDGTGPKPI
jgi:micrococcal nuclease